MLNLRNDHELGSPLFSMKILDVGCGGGLLTEVTIAHLIMMNVLLFCL